MIETAPHGERPHTLWHLIAGPTIWSIYFLACYGAAAIRCAKAGREAGFGALRPTLIGLTVIALLAIGASALHAWHAWRAGAPSLPPHDEDTPESRQQFVAFATLLLSGLSLVATIYVAFPAVVFASCR